MLRLRGRDESLDYRNKRIAVIGNGSSGIQTFTALQPEAENITHYIRQPTWLSQSYLIPFTRNGDGKNFTYTDEEKENYKDPAKLFEYRKALEHLSNQVFKTFVLNDTAQESNSKLRAGLEEMVKDHLRCAPELHKYLIPDYTPRCRRLTPDGGYLESVTAPNACLLFGGISSVTSTGVTTVAGDSSPYDILVLATGFTNTRSLPWPQRGLSGALLSDLYTPNPDGYLSVCAPSQPNFFTIGCGPNYPAANGPVSSCFGFMADYVTRWIDKIATEDIHSATPKNEAVQAYNIYIQQVFRRTAWNDRCDSWYKAGQQDEYRTGITGIYPGSMLHFKAMLGEGLRGEDFEIKYRSQNRFRFFGNGLTTKDMDLDADLAEYLGESMRLDKII